MATVLVTGVEGLAGRACAAALAVRGHTVRALQGAALDEVTRRRLEAVGVTLAPGDVTDETAIERAARGAHYVVHTAEQPRGEGGLAEHERVNLIGTENVLAAAPRAGVVRIVHLSSEAVTAGDYDRDHVDEAFPQPDTFLEPYARTRALAEDLVVSASGTSGLETVVLRVGWLWGPDDNALLPALIRARRDRSLTLVSGGQCFVPTLYVDNLMAGVRAAMESAGAVGNVYYVTDDERITCRAFIGKLLACVGLSTPKKSLPYRVAYAAAWLADRTSKGTTSRRAEVVRFGRKALFNLTRAREELGYAPAMTVNEGVKQLGVWAQAVGGIDAIASGRVLEPVSTPNESAG